jgi:hypothetical protein
MSLMRATPGSADASCGRAKQRHAPSAAASSLAGLRMSASVMMVKKRIPTTERSMSFASDFVEYCDRKRAHDRSGFRQKPRHADRKKEMDEERFNLSMRKFLKAVGVTSQHEIENAVRAALSSGRLENQTQLEAKMTLEIAELGLTHVVDGHVDVG